MIDIGGPSLLRAASKNFRYITPIMDINDYEKLIQNIEKFDGKTDTFTDLGSLSITPKASTNKILVLFEQHIYVTELSSNSWRGANVRLLRDTTTIYGDPADQYGESFLLEGNIDRYMTYSTRQYLDSPSTTSSVTYKVQGN